MPATQKKKAAPIKLPAPSQTTLERLLNMAEAHGIAIDSVLAQLTEIRKTPSPIVVQGSAAPPETSNASTRLGALLVIISGKGAQQAFEDILARGIPPTKQDWLHEVDKFIARTDGKVAA